MKIYFASDHNGYYLKDKLKLFLARYPQYEVIDEGNKTLNPDDDFPNFAFRAVREIINNPDSLGVFICGSGQGMSMAANRFKGIRASLCWNKSEAIDARHDDNSNVLCLSSKFISVKENEDILWTWLNTEYSKASRFNRRIRELDQYGS